MNKLVGIIGAPTSGKSTLAMLLTAHMKIHGIKSVGFAEEYARKHIERYGRPKNITDQFLIMDNWMKEVYYANETYEYTVCDNAPFISYIFAMYFMNFSSDSDNQIMYKLHRMMIYDIKKFDRIYLLRINENHNVKDGLRTANYKAYYEIQQSIMGLLTMYRIPYTEVPVGYDVNKWIKRIIHEIENDVEPEVQDHLGEKGNTWKKNKN